MGMLPVGQFFDTGSASQLRYTPIFNLKYLLFNRQMLLYMVIGRNARVICK